MASMFDISEIELEHVLLFIIVAFMLYHFMGRGGCGCSSGNRGFRVGARPGKYGSIPFSQRKPGDYASSNGSGTSQQVKRAILRGKTRPHRKLKINKGKPMVPAKTKSEKFPENPVAGT